MDDFAKEIRSFKLGLPKKMEREGEQKFTLAAGGLVFAHNKVLLDRSDSSDLWSLPGGIVRFDESPQETVVREMREELNLNAKVLDPKPYVFHFTTGNEQNIEHIYLIHFLIQVEAPARIKMGGGVVDYKWTSIGSHFRDCYPNVQPAVDYYMNI
ncbi:MAG: NUDIX hydrolase [Candidatus Dojkabacteria bacterium]